MPLNNLGDHSDGALIAASQAQKEVTSNALDNLLSDATQKLLSLSVMIGSPAEFNLTDDQFFGSYLIKLTGAPAENFDLKVPPSGNHTFVLDNRTGRTATVRAGTGPGVAVDTGKRRTLHSDGTTVVALAPEHDSGGPVFQNAIINGNFDLWPEGTSFTGTAKYTAAQWRNSRGSGGAMTVTRQTFVPGQTDVPGEPRYFLRHDQTTAGSAAPSLHHRIEGVRSFAGQTVTFSIYGRVASATLAVTPRITQNFGTGGSPSPSANVDTVLADITLTTTWQRFDMTFDVPSIGGKEIGDNDDDYLEIRMKAPAAVFTADWAKASLVEGPIFREVERRSLAEELLLSQRYFVKTFDLETAPAQSAGTAGALSAAATSTGSFLLHWRFPVPLRAAPLITSYNPSAANAEARNETDLTDTPVAAINAGERSVSFAHNPLDASDANDRMSLHATADARL